MRTDKRINRREILKYAMGTCPAVCGFPSIVRASALGKNGSTAPSNRVVVGCIGNGNMGTYDIRGLTTQKNVHVAAICDVSKEKRLTAQTMLAKKYGNKDCKAYNDFREVLARDDIDAVSIAAQDHWHALIAVAAAKAGKDVYCQKPLGMTMEECQVVREVVRKEGTIFQTGTQQRSSLFFRQACELARNGYIGKVHTVEVGAPGPKYKRTYMNPPTEEPIPDGFDFERYVGPAKMRPYNRGLHTQPDWYLIRDYCVGFIVNWGVHHLDIANWGVPEITSGQCEVEFSGSYRDDGLTDNINDWRGEFRYPSGLKMAFSDVGNPCAKGIKFIGDEGWVYIDRGMFRAEPMSLLKTELRPEDKRLYPAARKAASHYRNFIDCVLSRQEPIAPVEAGAQASYLGMVAEISVKLGRKLTWDHEKERFVDDAAANALLSTPMRAPWSLS